MQCLWMCYEGLKHVKQIRLNSKQPSAIMSIIIIIISVEICIHFLYQVQLFNMQCLWMCHKGTMKVFFDLKHIQEERFCNLNNYD